MSEFVQIVTVIQEADLFTLLNLLRSSPSAFQSRLKTHISDLQACLAAPKAGLRSPEAIAKAISVLSEAERVVDSAKTVTRLHLSVGLSQAARDVVCSIGPFGFLAPVQKDQPVSLTFYPKYGSVRQLPVLENFAYDFPNALEALCSILVSTRSEVHGEAEGLGNARVRVVGVAVGLHQSMRNCAVIVSCGNYFEKQSTRPETVGLSLPAEAELFPIGLGKSVLKVSPI